MEDSHQIIIRVLNKQYYKKSSNKLSMGRRLTILSSVLFCFTLKAQEIKHISMNEAVSIAIQNNHHVKTAEIDRKISHANYKQTDAVFLPQIELGYTALSTNNPLNAFGFLLQQESVTEMDFNPVNLNHPGASQDYVATIEAKLPLLNMDRIYARKGAKAQEKVYQYKVQRTKEHIEFEVKKAYIQLQFSYQAHRILKESLLDVIQIYESVNNFYNQGLIQKSDVLNAKVHVNTVESALAKAESNIYNASDGLCLLMGNPPHLYSTDSLSQKEITTPASSLLTSRSDIMALYKALDASEMMIKSSQMAYLPRINAFGTYAFHDSKPLGFNADSYLIGLNISWSLFSGNQNRSKLKSSQLQRDRVQEELNHQVQQSQLEIDKTRRQLQDLQIEIDKEETSVEQAGEALRILTNRHREGLVSTTDLLMSQAQLAQQQLLLAQAIMSYNITQAYWDFLLETE